MIYAADQPTRFNIQIYDYVYGGIGNTTAIYIDVVYYNINYYSGDITEVPKHQNFIFSNSLMYLYLDYKFCDKHTKNLEICYPKYCDNSRAESYNNEDSSNISYIWLTIMFLLIVLLITIIL